MTRFVCLFAAISALCCAAFGASAPTELAAKVFPSALVEDRAGVVPVEQRHTSAMRANLNGDGSPLIAAVYSNGNRACVSVLSSDATPIVLGTQCPSSMVGMAADLALLDFDHDGRPEIVVTMQQARGLPTVWLFRWSGAAVLPIGPSDPSNPDEYDSTLADVTFVNLDAGGIGMIDHHASITCDDDGETHPSHSEALYLYVPGKGFEAGSAIDDFAVFTRAAGKAAAQVATLSARAAGPRDIILFNGELDGSHRVSSAEIQLNGRSIIDPDALNQNVGTVRLSALPFAAGDNVLTVKLTGAPGGTISVAVLPRQ